MSWHPWRPKFIFFEIFQLFLLAVTTSFTNHLLSDHCKTQPFDKNKNNVLKIKRISSVVLRSQNLWWLYDKTKMYARYRIVFLNLDWFGRQYNKCIYITYDMGLPANGTLAVRWTFGYGQSLANLCLRQTQR